MAAILVRIHCSLIVEELIALEGVGICELEAELNVFKGKFDPLENTHSNILELLHEKDYAAEFEVVEDFRDKAIRIQTKARRRIHGQQNRTVDILLRSFYEDDLIKSLDNEAEHTFSEVKFNLRGWKYTGDDYPEQVTSVLGLIWNRKEDELKINSDWIETYKLEIVSKRMILSIIHRVFNPIGFLCHVLIMPKLMLQKMWKDNIPWYKEVEDNLKIVFLK
ncbi:integrase catalytic domain-containing protein [Trichonephila clavata]|uniref:Integrase catalytic domain-containing protein n=1 Tax=Trichonephila clavata TaxID=2740835 RepID=A0A8X6KMD6_TRICU|nr:integrase catalytic domain-containing protein [Trichonephila clavata]